MKIIKTRYFTEFSGSLKIFLPNPANSGILLALRIRSSVGRVSVSEAEGRWFEPSRIRQIHKKQRQPENDMIFSGCLVF